MISLHRILSITSEINKEGPQQILGLTLPERRKHTDIIVVMYVVVFVPMHTYVVYIRRLTGMHCGTRTLVGAHVPNISRKRMLPKRALPLLRPT